MVQSGVGTTFRDFLKLPGHTKLIPWPEIRAAAAERALERQAWRDAVKNLAQLEFKKPPTGWMYDTCATRQPGSAVDPGPGSALDPGPGSALDPGPGSALDPGPGSAVDPGPGSAVDPGPGSSVDPGPGSALDPGPGLIYGALCHDCDLAEEEMEFVASGKASVKSRVKSVCYSVMEKLLPSLAVHFSHSSSCVCRQFGVATRTEIMAVGRLMTSSTLKLPGKDYKAEH
eukprot:363265-Chlamydomonas_euryale.AAC.7